MANYKILFTFLIFIELCGCFPFNLDKIASNIFGSGVLDKLGDAETCDVGEMTCPTRNLKGQVICYKDCERCDSDLSCPDATDEVNCPCKSRLPAALICNGIFDCKDMSDELGCKECRTDELSCASADPRPCVELSSFCLGHPCSPHSRQLACIRLSLKQIDPSPLLQYKSRGYLQSFFREKWLPVCGARDDILATFVDEYCHELTSIYATHKLEQRGLQQGYRGPWMNLRNDPRNGGVLKFVTRDCESNMLTYVECPTQSCQDKPSKPDALGNNLYERIVGGTDAQLDSWQFLVVILHNNIPLCGGSIISPRWVLSAGHCFPKISGEFYEVQTNHWQASSMAPYVQRSPVATVLRHPQFDPFTMTNDIALLRLQTPFEFNRWVKPTCFNKSLEVKPGHLCTLAGWGKLEETGHLSSKLQELQVPVLTPERCYEQYDFIDSKMVFCAGYEEGGKDSCQGDSGSPMMCQDCDTRKNPFECLDKPWSQHGLVSYGSGCARPGLSGVYTNVSVFLEWIFQTMNKFDADPNSFSRKAVPTLECPGVSCTTENGTCLPLTLKCDGRLDCYDASDESSCTSGSSEKVEGTFPALPPPGEDEPPKVQEDESGFLIEDHGHPREKTCPDGFFQCAKSKSCIPSDFLCDEVYNCEDATDERGCSCGDYLYRDHPERYCDGQYDCFDYSDEPCQSTCDITEWFCRKSEKCIPRSQKCNKDQNCYLGEDELNCVTLSDSKSGVLKLDVEGVPIPYKNGSIVYYSPEEKSWLPVCGDHIDRDLGSHVCSYLGYEEPVAISSIPGMSTKVSYYYDVPRSKRSFLNSDFPSKRGLAGGRTVRAADSLTSSESQVGKFNKNYFAPKKSAFNISAVVGANQRHKRDTCSQIYLECGDRLCGKIPGNYFTDTAPTGRNGVVPWAVSIYVAGEFRCGGTLIEDQWVLTSQKCLGNLSLSEENVYVLAGSHRENVRPRMLGSKEVEFRVDSALPLGDPWDVTLLHTNASIQHHGHLNTLCWRNSSDIFNGNESRLAECVMAGLHGSRPTYPLLLTPRLNDLTCPSDEVCFEDYLLCFHEWSGLIACRANLEEDSTWRATALWSYKPQGSSCPPDVTRSHPRVTEDLVAQIEDILDSPLPISYPEVPCEAHKCPLGRCLPLDQVCDGKVSCADLSDEHFECPPTASHCIRNPQNPLECRCESGFASCAGKFCVDEKKLCDGVSDCPDAEDEQDCGCSSLSSSSLAKVPCDGFIDCTDQSDEKECHCNATTQYRCFRGNVTNCIDAQWLCDTIPDCLGHEDEDFCISITSSLVVNEDALRRPVPDPMGYIVMRLWDQWFTIDDDQWTVSMSDFVCTKLGFHGSVSTRRRLVHLPKLGKMSGPITAGMIRGDFTSKPLSKVIYVECLY